LIPIDHTSELEKGLAENLKYHSTQTNSHTCWQALALVLVLPTKELGTVYLAPVIRQ